MFFWNSLAFSMIQEMLSIWHLVLLPFLKPAWTSGSSQFMYCWNLAWLIREGNGTPFQCSCLEKSRDCGAWWAAVYGVTQSRTHLKRLSSSSLENFEHYFTSVWDECNCVEVWVFFGFAFLWDRNENWPFPVLWPLLSFPNLLSYWVQHFLGIIF